MRGGSEKGIGRETSSKAKKNVVGRGRERADEEEEDGRKRRDESEIPRRKMRKIPGNEEAK